MRRYHPQGERYYWVLYYSYLSSTKLENVEEILDKLELIFRNIPESIELHTSVGENRLLKLLEAYYGAMKGKASAY